MDGKPSSRPAAHRSAARGGRRFLIRALALGVGCFLALGVVELGLRVLRPIDLPLRGNQIVLPVNKRFTFINEHVGGLDRTIHVTHNRLGFRGPEPLPRSDDRPRIVTVGGSTTVCKFQSDDKTWPALLGRRLSERVGDVWLNNAGINGHSSFGHTHLLRNVLLELQPDYVVYLVGVNDVGRDDLKSEDAMSLLENQSFGERAVQQSMLLSTAQVLYRTYRAFDQGVAAFWQIDITTGETAAESPEELAVILQGHGPYVAAYRERLQQLVRETVEGGIEPILVTQPALYGDALDPTTGVAIGSQRHLDHSVRTHWQVLELYNDATRSVGRETDVLVVDLARQMPKDSALYYDWIHFTNSGADEVANLLADELALHLTP